MINKRKVVMKCGKLKILAAITKKEVTVNAHRYEP